MNLDQCDALSIYHREQARTTAGSEGASKDPEKGCFAMPISGILTRIIQNYCRAL